MLILNESTVIQATSNGNCSMYRLQSNFIYLHNVSSDTLSYLPQKIF